MKKKLIRTSTIPASLNTFCRGMLKMLNEHFEVVAVSSPDEALNEIAQREGVRTAAVPMERHISIARDLKSLWLMVKVMRAERPYIVHSITPKAGLVTMLAAWLTRVPVRIHTFTGLVWPTATGLKRRILMATDWLTCACATHVIPEGEGVKRDLLDHHITRKPIRVLGYGNIRGIDLEYYKPQPSVGKNDTGFTFVFVGRIVREKGINELVAAFKRLQAIHAGARLVLVGAREDDLDPVMPQTVAEIEQNPAIIEAGRQKDVRPFFNEAHALVFPSYREGFPNVVIEAGAMGLPSIVTDINGSNEIITHGVNGVIVPPRNEQVLFEAMLRWVEHPDEAAALATNARSMVASRYEKSFVEQCLLNFYLNLTTR